MGQSCTTKSQCQKLGDQLAPQSQGSEEEWTQEVKTAPDSSPDHLS